MRTNKGWLIVGGLALIAVAALGLRQADVLRMRRALESKAPELDRAEAARRANEQRRAELRTLPTKEAELADARAARDAAKRELSSLPPLADAAATSRFKLGADVSASDWRNVGRATPQDTLETTLWAAAGGDVETLAGLVSFADARARAAAQKLFDGLSEAQKAQYQTPERLVAALTVPRIPSGGSARVEYYGSNAANPNEPPTRVAATVVISAPNTQSRRTIVPLNAGEDGWRLSVPTAAVNYLARQLQGSSGPGATR